MKNRPTGIYPPPSREFVIGVPTPKPYSRKDRLRDRWFHFKTFSLGRGCVIELDIDDEVIKSLHEIGWAHRINDKWFMTRKGSREFNQFLREEHDRIGQRKRKEN
jgi:hypothetical protein